MRPFSLLVLFGIAGLVSGASCNMVPAEEYQKVVREQEHAEEQIKLLERQVSAQQDTIRTTTEQIATQANVEGSDPAEVLVVPERIELSGMSGGYDSDGKVGDEGIVLYIRPIDRDQHVVKSPGTLKVRLLDPQNPADRVVVADYYFDLPTTRSLWYGRLMTHHFAVKCPWPKGRLPAHDEITAHVEFTEIITGQSLTATGTYKVTFPPNRASDPSE